MNSKPLLCCLGCQGCFCDSSGSLTMILNILWTLVEAVQVFKNVLTQVTV